MGDPDFAKVPVAQLIDKKYAAAWRDSVDPNHASVSKDLKRPSIFNELERVAQSRLTTIREPENTTHYSVVDAEANTIGPGKRPLSAMTPTIVLKDGQLFLVLGSPGGPTIITTVANIVIGVVDFSLDLTEAVNAPRFHHQWLPDQILVEDRLSPDTMK